MSPTTKCKVGGRPNCKPQILLGPYLLLDNAFTACLSYSLNNDRCLDVDYTMLTKVWRKNTCVKKIVPSALPSNHCYYLSDKRLGLNGDNNVRIDEQTAMRIVNCMNLLESRLPNSSITVYSEYYLSELLSLQYKLNDIKFQIHLLNRLYKGK